MQKDIVLAGMARVPEQVDQDKAMECWKKNTCETGTGGKLTVGLADGFGGNVARQIFKMEFILQALTYKDIGKIVYTDANLDTQKAISDMRSMIAQGVNVIVSYPDAGKALLPVYRQATQRKVPVALWSNANIGKPGTDYLTYSGQDICSLGKSYADDHEQAAARRRRDRVPRRHAGQHAVPRLAEVRAGGAEPQHQGRRDRGHELDAPGRAAGHVRDPEPSTPTSRAFSYDYGDAFVGAMRAFKAANKPLDVVATIQSDDNPLLCAWKKEDNPNFKVWRACRAVHAGPDRADGGDDEAAGGPDPVRRSSSSRRCGGWTRAPARRPPRERVAVLDGPGGPAAEDVRQVRRDPAGVDRSRIRLAPSSSR